MNKSELSFKKFIEELKKIITENKLKIIKHKNKKIRLYYPKENLEFCLVTAVCFFRYNLLFQDEEVTKAGAKLYLQPKILNFIVRFSDGQNDKSSFHRHLSKIFK